MSTQFPTQNSLRFHQRYIFSRATLSNSLRNGKLDLDIMGDKVKKMIVNIFLLCRFVIIWCYSFYLKLPLLLGGESFHHEFRNLRETYCGMENDVVGRLLSMLKRHHVKIHPEVQRHRPVKKHEVHIKKVKKHNISCVKYLANCV